MDTAIEFEARAVVRSYSFEVEQRLDESASAQNLGRALVEERNEGRLDYIKSPWRLFFESTGVESEASDHATDILQAESVRLRKKWVTFYEKFPKNEQVDLENSKPTIKDLNDMVASITTEWQAKRKGGRMGRVKSLFHRFCGTLHSHSSLIKLLPEGNEYVSIFTGTLTAIIKASVNHEKIVEDLAEGLCVISERIEETTTALTLFETEAIKKRIADLYGHIFLFLNGVMDWIIQTRFRRLMDSFVENFKERFDSELKRINEKVHGILVIATQSSQAETRYTRLLLEDLTRDIRLVRDDQRRYIAEKELADARRERYRLQAEEDKRLEKYRQRELGRHVVILLEADATEWLWNPTIASPVTTIRAGPRPGMSPVLMLNTSGEAQESEDVAVNSRHLEDFFSRGRVRLPADAFGSATLNQELLGRLQEWAQGLSAPILWLEGPADECDEFENPLTGVAAKFIEMATKHRFTVVSFFCELPRRSSSQQTPQEQAAISLLYALLRQMIEVLPPKLDTTVDLSERRFNELDGSLNTWDNALELLSDVTSFVPGIVFCIIESFHWLDAKTTENPLTQLLQVLRNEKFRVLFTTHGRSGCLLQTLGREEMLDLTDTCARSDAGDFSSNIDL